MSQFLIIAEKVYKKFEDSKLFSDNIIEQLNSLVSIIRQELKGTPYKLKYNFINFEECISKPLSECMVKLDISLMPSYKNKCEYIMWLASFIERITTGGQRKFPPLKKHKPHTVLQDMGSEEVKAHKVDLGKMITNYFDSPEFKKVLGKN
ncbi:hypothetical protein MSG66_15330 [Acinetobacter sp. IK31]|uniref:hypothetical protein n=1 Tax=Acinetobacter sp. IK31 TaxID=2928895 RepID=UPI002D1FE7C9|nr:hypothetical protein [Acinetobacter sp. IK31]MEB3865374.1 hypothetical protein [Acinetobacter sp. IK31]